MQGIKREIDHVGRMVIPMEMRKALGIEFNSEVVVSLSDDSIVVKPKNAICALCGHKIQSTQIVRLCSECIPRVKELPD